ncbi:MAG: DNA polymerase III subunit delta [Pseudomonadota bacterium]
MKLAGRQALAFCARPDAAVSGVLIHGADAGQVMAARQALVKSVLGDPVDDLRLTRIDAAEARKDAAAVGDALRAQGFFPGRRVVLVEGASDGAAKPFGAALEGADAADALLVATADALPTRSALRKLFEGAGGLMALQLFADGWDRADIGPALAQQGLACGISEDAVEVLAAALHGMDHGSGQRLLELVVLFGMDRGEPISATEVSRLVPAGLGADTDDLVTAIAGGSPERIGPLLRRIAAEGSAPVGVLLAMQRHFRQLLQAGSAPGGPSAGLAALRPPVWGPRRDQMQGQLRRWTAARLEQACRLLLEVDAGLRSSQLAPDWAVLERVALRLAIMGRG